jgi:Holliday junction resolvase RusA-like endonuclease
MEIMLGSNEITILGKPTALKRTRISGNHCYDSQKSEKLMVYLEVQKQWKSLKLPIYMDPIHLDVVFIFPIPESYSNAKKQMLKNSPRGITSDIDNLVKLLLDAVQGLCFSNDNLVASINAKKVYGSGQGKTVFSFKLL